MSRPYAKLPAWIDHGVIPLLNVVVAFLVAGLVVLAVGESPIEAARLMLRGAFGYGEGFGFTLFYTTNFILTGLAVAVAFHGGLFNIGGEGQAYVGGLGVAFVALNLGSVLPWWVNLPLAVIASFAVGAAWAFLPGYLQAKRGSHVVITTIMFNFIASALMVYLLVGPLRPIGTMQPETRQFDAGGQLPKLGSLFDALGFDLGGAPLNVTFFVALLAAVAVWVLIWRTRLGYEIRTLGFSPSAARYAGMKETRPRRHHHADLGRPCRHDGPELGDGRPVPASAELSGRRRLRRHRRRADGARAPGRHHSRRAALRHALTRAGRSSPSTCRRSRAT